jgi:hypothetical protein
MATVSDVEAPDLVALANALHDKLVAWLAAHRAELLP